MLVNFEKVRFAVAGVGRAILSSAVLSCLLAAACSNGTPSTGTGAHSCADCAQAAACCAAVLAAMGDTTSQCSSSEEICSTLSDITEQREYINGCDAYVMAHAEGDAAPAACQ
jgi:hypothetical protein